MNAGAQSKGSRCQSLFYEERAISKTQMADLLEKRARLKEKLETLDEQARKIHPPRAEEAVKKMREDLNMALNIVKEDGVIDKKSKLPLSVYDNDGRLTMEKLYDEWDHLIIKLNNTQQDLARKYVDKWFDNLKATTTGNRSVADVAADRDVEIERGAQGSSDLGTETDQSGSVLEISIVAWFAFLIIFCAINSLVTYSNEDVKECLDQPLKCMENIAFSFCKKTYKWYTAFHNITLEDRVEL